jgi:putative Ca2+/H+ antiporter (TMEM165/GDT1 family)
MPAFFLALIATFVAATGGRDQRLVAYLSYKSGASGGLLVAGWIACAVTATIAAIAGEGLAALLPPAGKQMMVAFALAWGAIELAWPVNPREPAEPTRSLTATVIVLASRQVGDAARFLIVAFAAATGSHWLAGTGGLIGGAAAITLGWALGADLSARLPLRAIRLGIAAVLFIAAVWTGAVARGIL